MSADLGTILTEIYKAREQYELVFLKNMAHHHIGLNLDYLTSLRNIFLIRDPRQLIASFAQVIEHPTLQDIGLKEEVDL